MIGKIILHMGRIQVKLGFGCWQVRFVSYCMQIAKLVMGLVEQPQPDSRSPYLYLETSTWIIMLTFFLKTANSIIKNWLVLSIQCHTCRTSSPFVVPPHMSNLLSNHPHHLRKCESKGIKISIFKLFSELGKTWKCNLGFSNISISHLFYELKTKFWIYGWIGKSYVLLGSVYLHCWK